MLGTRSHAAENKHLTNVAKGGVSVAKRGASGPRAALRDISNSGAVGDVGKSGGKKKEVTKFKESVKAESPIAPSEVEVEEEDEEEEVKEVAEPKPVKTLPFDEDREFDIEECTPYINDIFHYYRRIESNFMACPFYMERQTHVNAKMRSILIDWLVEVHMKFKLMPETLYLTVNFLDRFLEKKKVARQKLQLVGVTAMLLASKYEEVYFPEVADFAYITDNAYTREEILKFEGIMLNTLAFNFTVASPFRFLERFTRGTCEDSLIRILANYVCERQLQEIDMLRYKPSIIAASALYIAREHQESHPAWPRELQVYTELNVEDLDQCVRAMKLNVTKESSLKAVCKKYTSSKHSRVALLMQTHESA